METIAFAIPEKIHFESSRYAADDQYGFITLESDTCVGYKVDNFYNAECELGVKWNDPDLGINWKISEGEEILSEKDTNALSWQIFIKKLNENER